MKRLIPMKTVPFQYAALRSSPLISNGHGKLQNGYCSFEGIVSPTPTSHDYRIKVTYEKKRTPKVFVLDPHLPTLAGERKLPHVYKQDPTQLCLYFPQFEEWTGNKPIATTIIPWTILWLYYFEHWLATDVWMGGGTHPVAAQLGITEDKKEN